MSDYCISSIKIVPKSKKLPKQFHQIDSSLILMSNAAIGIAISQHHQNPTENNAGGDSSADSPDIVYIVSLSVLKITVGIIAILQILRYEDIQGHKIPIVFFKALPAWFEGFKVLIAVALSASISSFSARIRSRNKVARFCCWSSVVCLAGAVVVFLSATFASVLFDLQIPILKGID